MSAGDGSERWRQWSRPDPITFGTEVLGLRPSAKQRQYGLNWYTDDQKAISDSILANKRTLVKSCNGGGKTFWDALVALWAHNCGFRVLITATTLAQADAGVGGEIRKLLKLGPPGLSGKWSPVETHARYTELHELLTFSVQIGTDEEIAGSAAGRHYERMCFILDEANSLSRKIIEQVDRNCLNPNDIILATMNPTPATCAMRKISEVGNLWNVVTIDGYNHPNVVYNDPDIIPGAITREMIEEQRVKAGGNEEHFLFAPPVRGQYAGFSSDSLIHEEWITRSMARWEANNRPEEWRGRAVGIDIAGKGGDASSAYEMERFRLNKPMIPESFVRSPLARTDMPGLKAGAAWVRGREIEENVDMVKAVGHTVPDLRAMAIDRTGIGDSVTGEMRRYAKKLPKWIKQVWRNGVQTQEEHEVGIHGYNFGAGPEASTVKEKFKNIKHQILWTFARALENNEFDIPPKHVWASWGLPADVDIMEELLRPVWGIDSKGHTIVADQAGAECADDDMRERVKHMSSKSPNELQAMAMAFWEFRKLPKGLKPVTTAFELTAAVKEKQLAKDRREYKNRTRPAGGRYPWMIMRG